MASARVSSGLGWLPTVATFFSAFLLFLIQPLATKSILPELGGSPFVWGTAMVFFQFTLLLGYLFSYLLLRSHSFRVQSVGYGVVGLLGLAFLPLNILIHSYTDASLHPVWWIVISFSLSLAIPFFVLSTTNTLSQGWFARTVHPHAHNPYFLYAASNAGSLLALLAFPFAIEPFFDLDQIKFYWSIGFVLFLLLMVASLWLMSRNVRNTIPSQHAQEVAKPIGRIRAYWVFLAFIPSSLFISVTTFFTTDIASAPLLWVIPLALYLLSFIIAFSSLPEWLASKPKLLVVPFVLVFLSIIHAPSLAIQLAVLHFGLMFGFACWAHLLLARAKPHPTHLGEYYLWISVGGVLGGIFASLLAPVLFNGSWEYSLTIALAALLKPNQKDLSQHKRPWLEEYLFPILACGAALSLFWLTYLSLRNAIPSFVDATAWLKQYIPFLSITLLLQLLSGAVAIALLLRFYKRRIGFALVVATLFLFPSIVIKLNADGNILYAGRSFFGINTVYFDPALNANVFKHGTTLHGVQSKDPEKRLNVVSYYAPLMEVLDLVPARLRTYPIALGGLGAGTVLCLEKGAHFDAIEIDPEVIAIAQNPAYFSYLRDCPSTHTLMLGDARKRISEQPDETYRLIIMDAFTSDAIPLHLLTQEAITMYRDKLADGGMIAFNISNRFFDLRNLFGALAPLLGMEAFHKEFLADKKRDPLSFTSNWVFMTTPLAPDRKHAVLAKGWSQIPAGNARVWTDRYSNMLQFLR